MKYKCNRPYRNVVTRQHGSYLCRHTHTRTPTHTQAQTHTHTHKHARAHTPTRTIEINHLLYVSSECNCTETSQSLYRLLPISNYHCGRRTLVVNTFEHTLDILRIKNRPLRTILITWHSVKQAFSMTAK